ncbi:unnamed protein product [Arctogadus glacialis]
MQSKQARWRSANCPSCARWAWLEPSLVPRPPPRTGHRRRTGVEAAEVEVEAVEVVDNILLPVRGLRLERSESERQAEAEAEREGEGGSGACPVGAAPPHSGQQGQHEPRQARGGPSAAEQAPPPWRQEWVSGVGEARASLSPAGRGPPPLLS